jgi:hypothetical protein
MSALFAVHFVGKTLATGGLYIGNGQILGVDGDNGRYKGTYTEQGGQVNAKLTVTYPEGATLVTGDQVAPGTSVPISGSWPLAFAGGEAQTVMINGKPMSISFEKIGDIP